jgi:mannose-6-phosphate isomerase-like protein (cupin superfamily)
MLNNPTFFPMQITKLKEASSVPTDINGKIMWKGQDVEVIHLTLQPGKIIPAHSNPFDVVFYAIEGEAMLDCDKEQCLLEANSCTRVASGTQRGLENKSEKDFKVLVIKLLAH